MLRILLVDDNPFYRVALKAGLEKDGYQVLELAHGQHTVAVARTWKPDAILLDLDLPGLAGATVCAQLKEQSLTAGIPVILATARGVEADRIDGFEAGADAFVTKPFTLRDLESCLRVLIQRSRAN